MGLFKNMTKVRWLASEIRTLIRAYTDARTPVKTRLVIAVAALLYIVVPLDVIPELLPLLGILDDTMIIPILMWLLIPETVLDDARKHVAMTGKKKVHTHRWILWVCAAAIVVLVVYTVWKLAT